MKIQTEIEGLVRNEFEPVYFELVNESDMHSGPPGRESHFKLTLVTNKFEGLSRVSRSREVYKVLGDLLGTKSNSKVHALALHLYTEAEWDKLKKSPDSPLCANAPRKSN